MSCSIHTGFRKPWSSDVSVQGQCQEPYCEFAGAEVMNYKLIIYIVVLVASCCLQPAKQTFGSGSYETGTSYADSLLVVHGYTGSNSGVEMFVVLFWTYQLRTSVLKSHLLTNQPWSLTRAYYITQLTNPSRNAYQQACHGLAEPGPLPVQLLEIPTSGR